MRISKKLFIGVIALGTILGVAVAKKTKIDPGSYEGQSPEAATEALLGIAQEQAGDGSWENIHLARVYYLTGKKEHAESIIERVLRNNPEAGDWMRIGRVYYQAGEWEKAQEAFHKAVGLAPKDEDWLAEIGAYYNMQGERDMAEELFGRSFALGPSLNNTLTVAGSYLGVAPRKR